MWTRLLFIFITIEHIGCILNALTVATTTPENVTHQTSGTNATALILKKTGKATSVDPWQQHYRKFHQYDVNNLTSFAGGLVSLQKLYCPFANLCGNSTEYRGSNRYVYSNYYKT